jgi:acyl-CoA reductase-like NAD-dependent aldehyde dehydrogenase
MDEATRVGTLIDEAAAIQLETVLKEAVAAGAKVLIGGQRRGAQLQPDGGRQRATRLPHGRLRKLRAAGADHLSA